MLKLAALAHLPTWAVLFGVMELIVLATGATHNLRLGAFALYGSAALSFLLAIPIAYVIARRMLTRREKRLLNAMQGERAE